MGTGFNWRRERICSAFLVLTSFADEVAILEEQSLEFKGFY